MTNFRFLLGSISALACATAAAAQDIPPEGAQTGAAATDGGGIPDIVVTASRRSESVQKAALSIQAISADTLARANVTKAEDLSGIAPGVEIGTGGAFAQTYIRGVGNYAAQSFAESAVAYNLDGVYISRAWGVRGMFFDLERVEVLKGPQGTLYGRNASGGAINVISAKPKLGQVSGFLEGQVGNYNLFQGSGAVNLPLGDNFAIRVAGQVVSRDGYLTDGYDDDKTQSVRIHALWEPRDDFSILVSGNYQHTGGKGAGTVLNPQLPGDPFRGSSDPAVRNIITSQPGIGGLLTYPKDDGFMDIDIYGVSAEINANLGFAKLTILPAYRHSELRDLHYGPGFSVENNELDQQTSLEVRLSNESDRLKWVLGGFFFDEHQTNLPGRNTLVVRQGVNAQVSQSLDLRTRSYAAFGQATFSVTDRFRVTGGVRYTYEHKTDNEALLNYSFPPCAPPPEVTPTVEMAPLLCRRSIPIVGEQVYNNVTYKIGVEYDVGPQSMAYANMSTGFKSGGFFSAASPNTFLPEHLTAIEAGIKNRFLDGRLQANLELFYWRYRDHQESYTGPTSIPGVFSFVTVNAGRAKSYGADLDLQYRATPDDRIGLKVQYNPSNFDSFTYSNLTSAFGAPVTQCAVGPLVSGSQTVDCSGKPLLRAPRWSGNVSYSHTFNFANGANLVASGDVQFASQSELAINFLNATRQNAYAMGNLDLSYTSNNGRWSISAFARNIWNEKVLNQAFRYPFVNAGNPLANPEGVVFATARAPRTFGGRIRVNF